jgi:type III secretory pathway component EscR
VVLVGEQWHAFVMGFFLFLPYVLYSVVLQSFFVCCCWGCM